MPPSAACASRNGARRLIASVRSNCPASTSSYAGHGRRAVVRHDDVHAAERVLDIARPTAPAPRDPPGPRRTPAPRLRGADLVSERCAAVLARAVTDAHRRALVGQPAADRGADAAAASGDERHPPGQLSQRPAPRPPAAPPPPARRRRLDLDRTGRVPVHDHVEAGALGVQRGRLDAVVQRQAGDVHGVHVAFAQQALELGALEPRVALEVGRLALVDDRVDLTRVDAGVQRRTRGVLYAVHRPRAAAVGKRAVVGSDASRASRRRTASPRRAG